MITLEEVKTYLNITGTDDDLYLQQQILFSESIIQSYCGRKFDYLEETQKIVKPTKHLFLIRFPLETVTSITDQDSNTYSENDFILDEQTGLVSYTSDGCPWSQPKFLTVVYTGGFVDCPDDLKAVLLDMVATRYYQRGEDITRPLKSEKVDGIGSKAYAVNPDFFAGQSGGYGNFAVSNYAAILDLYKIETVIA